MSFIKRIITKILIFSIVLFTIASIASLVIYTRYPLDYKAYIGKYANENDLDPYLVASVINVESRFDKNAISPKSARGLMQIGEQTGQWGAKELKIDNYTNDRLFEPKQNIRIGTWYLKNLEKEFDGKLDLILAAYNGGSGNVNKWLKDKEYSNDGVTLEKIPFKETENYLKRVKTNYKMYKNIYKNVSFEDEGFNSIYIDFLYRIRSYIRDVG